MRREQSGGSCGLRMGCESSRLSVRRSMSWAFTRMVLTSTRMRCVLGAVLVVVIYHVVIYTSYSWDEGYGRMKTSPVAEWDQRAVFELTVDEVSSDYREKKNLFDLQMKAYMGESDRLNGTGSMVNNEDSECVLSDVELLIDSSGQSVNESNPYLFSSKITMGNISASHVGGVALRKDLNMACKARRFCFKSVPYSKMLSDNSFKAFSPDQKLRCMSHKANFGRHNDQGSGHKYVHKHPLTGDVL